MDRFGILDQMRDNWPGRLDMPQVQLLERKTRYVDDSILEEAVDIVMDTCRFPPLVKDMHRAIAEARSKQKARSRNSAKKKHRPGDEVDGVATLTPDEAKGELERILEQYPEAWDPAHLRIKLGTPEERTATLQLSLTRLYATALRKLIRLDPSHTIAPPQQHDLF